MKLGLVVGSRLAPRIAFLFPATTLTPDAQLAVILKVVILFALGKQTTCAVAELLEAELFVAHVGVGDFATEQATARLAQLGAGDRCPESPDEGDR